MPVKSLAELCLETCQKHITELTSFGNEEFLVPLDYVREILSRVTDPFQLRTIEINSPHVDSSEVWKRMILKEFPIESRDKKYAPRDPAKWYKVYEKYAAERQFSQQEAEEKMRRQFQGLQEKKDSRVSKLVDQRFLPRPPKTGRNLGSQNRLSKALPSSLSFGGGSRTKMNTGASVLRRAKREAAEHALMRGILSKPSSNQPSGTVRKAPESMVLERRIAAQPTFRPRSSLQRSSALTRGIDPRPTSANARFEDMHESPNYVSDSSSEDGDSTTGTFSTRPQGTRNTSGIATSHRTQKSLGTTGGPNNAPQRAVKRPGLLSNAPKREAPSRPRGESPRKSEASLLSPSAVGSSVTAVRSDKTPATSSLQKSHHHTSPPSAPPKAPLVPPGSPPLASQPKKRRAVDIFMPSKKRR